MSTDPVIRAAEAETVDSPQHLIRLLADGINTAGVFSIIQVELRAGRDGAAPHFHSGFSELLYVIDGDVEVLCDDRISMAHAGDLVVVPPGTAHAFGALASGPASLLAVISPRHRPLPVLPPPRRRGQRRDPAPARRRPGALRQQAGRECSLAAGPGPLTSSLVKSAGLLLPRFPSSFARQHPARHG